MVYVRDGYGGAIALGDILLRGAVMPHNLTIDEEVEIQLDHRPIQAMIYSC